MVVEPTQGMSTLARLPRVAAAGAVAGLGVGIADLLLSLSWQLALASDLFGSLILLHVTVGALLAVALWSLWRQWANFLARFLVSRAMALAAGGGVLLAMGISCTQVYLNWRGLGWTALPWDGVAILGFAAALFFLILRLPQIRCNYLKAALTFGAVLTTMRVCFLLVLPPAGAAVHPVLDKTLSSRLALRALRVLSDRDGDGFPTAYCGGVCDCDDSSKAINPAAHEVLDNDIDEDCDGADLRMSDLQKILGPTAQAQPPRPDVPSSGGKPEESNQTPAPATEEATGKDTTAPHAEADNPSPQPNFLLVIVDTMRADHVSCLGYKLNTTPRIDELAQKSVLFTQARSQGSRTPWSFPSFLTGRYHSEIAADQKSFPRIHEENVFLSETLNDSGYATWAISSYIYYVPENGFAQGFEGFDVELHTLRHHIRKKPTSDLVTDRTLAQIDRWSAKDNRPFFYVAHYADPHAPYVRHKGFEGFGKERSRRYDGELQFVDHHVGRLLDGIRERKLADNTVVIVMSDHGEGLSEEDDHGDKGHGQNLFDEQIRVPLIIHVPGGQAAVANHPVGLIDLAPTILELANIPSKGPLSGFSLVPAINGTPFTRAPVYSEKPYPKHKTRVAMVRWPYKLHWRVTRNKFRLFNLETDPGETKDLSKSEPQVLKKMKAEAQLWRAQLKRPK